MCTPGVRGACARYMAANLPAPITPTRNGRPWASRSLSFAWRFIGALGRELGLERRLGRAVLPRQRHVVLRQQAVVGQAADRGEVPVRDVLRPLEAPDMIRDRA